MCDNLCRILYHDRLGIVRERRFRRLLHRDGGAMGRGNNGRSIQRLLHFGRVDRSTGEVPHDRRAVDHLSVCSRKSGRIALRGVALLEGAGP